MVAHEDEESLKRAELFDVLGHPTRIRVLRTLEGGALSFSELKRALDIESSGNLQHHLGKLGDLVKQTDDGRYAITDDAKEALRLVDSIEQKSAPTRAVQVESRKTRLSLFGLAVVVALLLVIAIYEHSLILKSIPLFDSINLSEKTLTLFGEKYAYLALTTAELQNGTRVTFHGAVFTYVNRSLSFVSMNFSEITSVFQGVTLTVELPEVEAFNMSKILLSFAYSRYFTVEFEDSEVETIPILPWPPLPFVAYSRERLSAPLRVMIYYLSGTRRISNKTIEVVYFEERGLYPILPEYTYRAFAFDIGQQTIMLLVKSDG